MLMENPKAETRKGWDLGLDYDRTYRQILGKIEELRGKRTVTARRKLAYSIVLLTQLRNGSRVSEAVDAVAEWVSSKKREVEVTVRKQRKNPEKRIMVVPKQLSEQDRLDVSGLRDWLLRDRTRIEHFARREFGWNTHSLRYAKVSQLSALGYPPQVIARITHHKKLDYIMRYTSQKLADEALRKVE